MYPRSQPSRQLCPPLSSHWGTMIPLRILIFTYVMLPWIVSSAAKGEYMEARTPAVRKLWGEVQNYLQGRYAQKWELTEMISSFCRKLRYVRRTMASCKTQILMVEYFQKQKVRFITKKKKFSTTLSKLIMQHLQRHSSTFLWMELKLMLRNNGTDQVSSAKLGAVHFQVHTQLFLV